MQRGPPSPPPVLYVVYFHVAALTPHHLECAVSVAFVLKMNSRFGLKVARMVTREEEVWPDLRGIGAISGCIR